MTAKARRLVVSVDNRTYELAGRLAEMTLILLENREKVATANKGKLCLFFAGDSVRASLEDQLTP